MKNKNKQIKLFKKLIKLNITKEEMLVILDEDVFNDVDFLRQIKETSISLKIEEEIILTVVKSFITFAALQVVKVKKQVRRIKIYAFLNLVVNENSIDNNKLN